MATIRRTGADTITLGSETKRAEHDQSLSIGSRVHDVMAFLAENNATGTVTLWDASTSAVATFGYLGIFVDPDLVATAATAKPMEIEIQVNTTVLVFNVYRHQPLKFGVQAAGTVLGTTSSTINRVRARNSNPADANKNDLYVRCLAISAT